MSPLLRAPLWISQSAWCFPTWQVGWSPAFPHTFFSSGLSGIWRYLSNLETRSQWDLFKARAICAFPPLFGQSLSQHMPANSTGNPAPRSWEQLWFFPLMVSSELCPPATTSLVGINPDIQHLALLYLQRRVVLALPPLPQLVSSWWFYLYFYLLQTPGSLLYFPRQQHCYQCQIFQAVRTLLNRNSLKPLTGSLKVKHLTILHWG